MHWLDSLREEHQRKKEEDAELLALYKEIIEQFYL